MGCFLAGLSKNLGVYVIGAVCVGAGYSVCESVSSAVLSELDAEKGARYINLSQALLSLGAEMRFSHQVIGIERASSFMLCCHSQCARLCRRTAQKPG